MKIKYNGSDLFWLEPNEHEWRSPFIKALQGEEIGEIEFGISEITYHDEPAGWTLKIELAGRDH